MVDDQSPVVFLHVDDVTAGNFVEVLVVQLGQHLIHALLVHEYTPFSKAAVPNIAILMNHEEEHPSEFREVGHYPLLCVI